MTPGQAEQSERDLRLANQALEAATLELDRGFTERAASSLYYAVFHAARAALTSKGSYSKSHSGQIHLFEQNFGTAAILRQLLSLRTEADYAMKEFTGTVEGLREKARQAGDFMQRCRSIVDSEKAAGANDPDPSPDL